MSQMPVASIVAAFTRRRGVIVEPGWGAGNVVLKLGAKIFAIVGEDRLVVKLPKARVDELVAAKSGMRFDPRKNGRVMKEWLVVGPRADGPALAKEAHAFASKAAASRREPAPPGASSDRASPKRSRTPS
jgi:proline racemase